jgi:hypothetical protein
MGSRSCGYWRAEKGGDAKMPIVKTKTGYRLGPKGKVFPTRLQALTRGGERNVPLKPRRERLAAAAK